jgi:ribonuclease HII
MYKIVVGVDEVGRGCLAGPVVTAAVVIPALVADQQPWVEEIKDSKKLTHKKRVELSKLITDTCHWAIRDSSVLCIEDTNILQATLRAMKESVDALSGQIKPDLVLVDGNQRIPDLEFPQETIKNGDNLYKCIGAASIIAKVYRDNYMTGMHQHFPQYNWAKNKGYGTEEHRQAIMEYGITKEHRKTFRGVTEYV